MKIRDIIQEDSGMGGVTSSGSFATVPGQIGGIIKRSPLAGQSIYPAKKKKTLRIKQDLNSFNS